MSGEPRDGPLARLFAFCLDNGLVVALLVALAVVWGVVCAPFEWSVPGLARDPVPVDAIPDTGDNQQIVFTEWPGRSPQDVEDQITYPLTVALLGVPGVKSIRSSSMFGFSSIFVVFEDGVDFYWSRSRLLEKLSSLPASTLPGGVQPALGPDATALGQVFWYTLEGRDEEGRPAPGFEPQELRSLQDWYVRYALASVEGVAEVASIGGFVQEYQVDVDPDAMRAHGITLQQVFRAVAASNVDVGARTLEVNRSEYVVRGLGLVESIEDLEQVVVGVADNVPILVRQIATVSLGPALRRGALDKGGAEAVGGVVVARYGANPLEVIARVKAKLAELQPGMPTKRLEDGRLARVTVVPFYDRSGLIRETLGTLNEALELQVLVTLVVVLVMVGHLGSALVVSALVPLAVLLCFVAMRYFGVDANVVALSGIAIAIGTLVDVGIVVTENVLRQVEPGMNARQLRDAVLRGAHEVGGAVATAVATTVIGFLPVFALEGAEGRLFRPLAYTKTFALVASILVALVAVPPAMRMVLGRRGARTGAGGPGRAASLVLALIVALVLAARWQPLGPARPLAGALFTLGALGAVLIAFHFAARCYEPVLRWCLAHKLAFLSLPSALVAFGAVTWIGFDRLAGPLASPLAAVGNGLGAGGERPLRAEDVRSSRPWSGAAHTFPGLGKEFMPPLDEGSFLLMPVTMAHASIGEALDMLREQDLRVQQIPEVSQVVGKIGRVESPLDPAPISMVETVVNYLPEFLVDASGRRLRFAYDENAAEFVRDERGRLVPDDGGRPYRQWREHIRAPRDIWEEVRAAAELPGMTTASMLQPIETRRIMLQTGLRAPMGLKVLGPDLESLERAALALEHHLKAAPGVRPETVVADRVIGKPYLELDIDREAIARYGLTVRDVQDVIEVAVGGRQLTTTVEGRARYPVRVRYARELRDDPDELAGILVPTPSGPQVPLGQLAEIRYSPGPQSIKSEDTFLVAYVLFDKHPGRAEVDVVEEARAYLEERLARGELELPEGVSYRFSGSYENQARAAATLRLVVPIALVLIFLLLYLQFKRVGTTAMVFTGVLVAWAGGFLMLWLYGREGFLEVELLGANLRELFGVRPTNLSVAVWVGFLALFGIATDDGVLMGTYLKQTFERERPRTVAEVRDAVVAAGARRIRPCLMTTATTLLALLPVLTSSGRGADVMVPMAIPSFGGMAVALVTILVVPTLYSLVEERRLVRREGGAAGS